MYRISLQFSRFDTQNRIYLRETPSQCSIVKQAHAGALNCETRLLSSLCALTISVDACGASAFLVSTCCPASGFACLWVVLLVCVDLAPYAGRLTGTRIPVAADRCAAGRSSVAKLKNVAAPIVNSTSRCSVLALLLGGGRDGHPNRLLSSSGDREAFVTIDVTASGRRDARIEQTLIGGYHHPAMSKRFHLLAATVGVYIF